MKRTMYAGVAIAAALALSGCTVSSGSSGDAPPTATDGGDGPLTIGIAALGLQYAFSAGMSEGFAAEAQRLGVTIVELDGEADTERQAANVQDLITQGVDGIILVPVNGEAAQSLVDQIDAAGIPVIAAGTQVGAPGLDVDDVYEGLAALVLQDEVETGRIAAQEAVRLLPDGGKIALVEGPPGFNEVRWRSQGFEEVVGAAGNLEIVARQPGDWDPAKGEAACQNMLQANPDIALFYSQEDLMGQGCQRAVAAAGSDAFVITNSGGTASGLQAVADGTIAATLCFLPATMAATALDAMVDVLRGQSLPSRFISYDTPLITAANIGDCVSEW